MSFRSASARNRPLAGLQAQFNSMYSEVPTAPPRTVSPCARLGWLTLPTHTSGPRVSILAAGVPYPCFPAVGADECPSGALVGHTVVQERKYDFKKCCKDKCLLNFYILKNIDTLIIPKQKEYDELRER